MEQIGHLVLLIFVGIIGGMIAKKLKQPVIVGYILASALFSTFYPLEQNSENFIHSLATIGVTLLLFSIGIEFSLDKLLTVKKFAIIGGICQILLVTFFGILLFPSFGFNSYESLFLGTIFSMSSTAVVVRILEELDLLDSFSSEITMGWLVLQDIAVVFIIILLGKLASSEVASADILMAFVKSFILIATSLIIGRKILPKILTSIASLGSKELVIISAFGFSLLFALLAENLGVSATLGAFLAGLMISESILHHEIITEINPLQAIFSMLFFVTIGSLFSLQFVWNNLGSIILILLVIILAKIIIVLLLCLILKLHFKTALEIALNLGQIGEFAFLSAQIALSNNWISSDLNSIIIAVTVLSLVATPTIIMNTTRIYQALGVFTRNTFPAIYRKLFTKILTDDQEAHEITNHVVILGYGRVGKYLSLALKKMRNKFLVVELNNIESIIDELGKERVIIGDATNTDVLLAANIEKAKIAIITLPKEADVGEIIRVAKGLNPEIQLIIRKHHDSLFFNNEDVFAVIEPEFEATLKMLEKLLNALRKKDKKIISWVKAQKRLH